MAEMTVRQNLEFAGRCQGVGFKYGKKPCVCLCSVQCTYFLVCHLKNKLKKKTDMLVELARREKLAGIVADEDLDIFMKVNCCFKLILISFSMFNHTLDSIRTL